MQPSKFIVMIGLVIALGACASTAQHRSLGEGIDDSVLSTKVKTKLLSTKEVKGLAIHVHTWKGQVTLKGKVHSQAEEEAALAAAREVKGVKEVRSKLVVSAAGKEKSKADSYKAKRQNGVSERNLNPRDIHETRAPTANKETEKKLEDNHKNDRDRHEGTVESVKEDTGFWTRAPKENF